MTPEQEKQFATNERASEILEDKEIPLKPLVATKGQVVATSAIGAVALVPAVKDIFDLLMNNSESLASFGTTISYYVPAPYGLYAAAFLSALGVFLTALKARGGKVVSKEDKKVLDRAEY
jgi:hypothetical protein